MPVEETGEARVRTDCLNFYVSLCMQIKKQIFQSEGEGIGFILFRAAVQDCTKFPRNKRSLYSNN